MGTLPKNKKITIFPCRGIGDALLMMIASEQLRREGFNVVTAHPKLHEFQEWFPSHAFIAQPTFSSETWIIAENDNSQQIQFLKEHYRENLSIFYPTYSYQKHGTLHPNDRLFNTQKSMAENIAVAIASILRLPSFSKDNGIVPPAAFSHRIHRHRVVIHDTSASEEKNWLKEKYDEVAKGLEKRGFEPVFAPKFETLSELAAYIYESGFVIGNDSLLGHLASNLAIPTLIIADKKERMQLWRPGWLYGRTVTLADWLSPWRFFEKNWQYFISSNRVLRVFDDLSQIY